MTNKEFADELIGMVLEAIWESLERLDPVVSAHLRAEVLEKLEDHSESCIPRAS